MSLKAQATRGLKWQLIELVGRQLLSLGVFALLSRLLEPAMFGIFGLVGVYLSFVSMFVTQGVGSALIQRRDLEPQHVDAAFLSNVTCAALLCLGTLVFAEPVSALFHEPALAPYLRWSSLALLINAASSIHGTLFVREMDFRRPAIRMLLSNFIGGVVGVGMAFGGYGVWALVGQQLSGSLVSAIFLWSVSSYRPNFKFSLKHFLDLRSVSSSVFITTLLWFFSTRLDQMAIGRYLSASTLGLYVIAGKLPELAKLITQQPVAQVSLPALSKLQNDHAQMRQAIYRGMELAAIISFAVFVGLASVSSDLVPLMFGAKWLPAATLCSLLAIYALGNCLQVFFHPALLASGGAGKYVLLNIWHVCGVLVACFVGINYGINYLVLGLIINTVSVAVLALHFLKNRIGLSPLEYARPCALPALAATCMAGVIWLMTHFLPADTRPIVGLICKVPAGAIIYLGLLFLLAPDSLKRLINTVGHGLPKLKRFSKTANPSPTEINP